MGTPRHELAITMADAAHAWLALLDGDQRRTAVGDALSDDHGWRPVASSRPRTTPVSATLLRRLLSTYFDPYYHRPQGPRLLIEWDNTQRGANHAHSVWRDLESDFGA